MSEPFQTRFPGILETVARYYGDRLERFGSTPQGVDWNSAESQQLRFARLLTVAATPGPLDLIDFGCGYGALADLLRARSATTSYQGFDVSTPMIACARRLHAADPWCSFTTDVTELHQADYAVASGIFNVKLHHRGEAWQEYVLSTLDTMNALGRRGFAFNMLTSYSDPEKRRSDLFYADPLRWFDLCKRRFSSRVALLHDYPLYEFTLLVRK
jgi:hypothetical protein